MKKGKKDRGIAQKVRVKNRDNEMEMKEHIHALHIYALADKNIKEKKSKKN